ncbi:MAG: DUF1285 domain-containing protein [Hyphomicrobiales bacterium]|jgi:hypothetical protein|nr:DUF1285 domain-containing protein [Hyphomicrobiales bacterium]
MVEANGCTQEIAGMSLPALPPHFLEFAEANAGRKSPPVEKWNPAYCGEIDMRIAADGRWFYQGGPINRLPLVKLFASILRKDAGRHVLVTPVERVGIRVDDAPFIAVEMEESRTPEGPALVFRTNLDEIVVAGAEHPMCLTLAADGGFKPYIRVRGDLWALATRRIAQELAERLEETDKGFVLRSAGVDFALPPENAPSGPGPAKDRHG